MAVTHEYLQADYEANPLGQLSVYDAVELTIMIGVDGHIPSLPLSHSHVLNLRRTRQNCLPTLIKRPNRTNGVDCL